MVEQKRATTEQLLRQTSAGRGAFGAMARRYSEDPGSKAADGYLAPAARGQFVAPFEVAAWALQPGGISGVVRSPFGFHVIRRPPLAEVRDSFAAGLERAIANRLDSVYVDSLAVRRGLRVKSGAPALVRQVFGDLVSARTDTRTLVTYRGGVFRVRDLVRWIFAIDPGEVRFLPTASDDQLVQFLGLVTKRELLLAQVDSAGVQLTPDEWRQVKAAHDSAIGLLERELGLSAALFVDSAPTPAARGQLAAAHVNAYLGRALAREVEFDQAYIFKYSPRRDTPAADMPGQLFTAVKEERNERLLRLVNEIAGRHYEKLVGTQTQILVEGPSKKNPARMMGRTRCNKIVVFDGSERHRGQIMDVKIIRAGSFTLYGDPAILE